MSNQIICPECRSNEVRHLTLNILSDNMHRCLNPECMNEWDLDTRQEGPKHPEIEVQLVGNDSNAFFIIGTVSRALRKARLSEHEVKNFNDEATSSDYDNLLKVCMEWVTVS